LRAGTLLAQDRNITPRPKSPRAPSSPHIRLRTSIGRLSQVKPFRRGNSVTAISWLCSSASCCTRDISTSLRGSASPEGQGTADASSLVPSTLHLPWTPTSPSARKGIAWKPSAQANLDPARSDTLLTAVARARSWMNDLSEGRPGLRRRPRLALLAAGVIHIAPRPKSLQRPRCSRESTERGKREDAGAP
jgi:hypothetical protein